jgi:hypothetical protein
MVLLREHSIHSHHGKQDHSVEDTSIVRTSYMSNLSLVDRQGLQRFLDPWLVSALMTLSPIGDFETEFL